MKIRDVMTREVVTVGPETPLREVAGMLAERGISGVPVVDGEGSVLGVVSEGDILFKETDRTARKGHGLLGWLLDPYGAEGELKLEARTAREAMSTPPLMIEPDRPVAAAASTMIELGVNRLPVVDRGKLVGIVTRADLVRAFARPDEALSAEIREDVLRRIVWLREPEAVKVAVEDGKVVLSGYVETRSEAELVSTFAARVPGVVEVSSTLTWRDDDAS
jgi:CBS domain-containing protein